MPHKRAKRSIREGDKVQRGTDLAPKLSVEDETIPKSVSRVLDAGKIRREYRERKRKLDGDDNQDNSHGRRKTRHVTDMKEDGVVGALKIQPGETVAHFNKRVESNMMPLIKTALQQSSAQSRKVRKQEVKQGTLGADGRSSHGLEQTSKEKTPTPRTATADGRVMSGQMGKEFQPASTAAPRRLNDIAQEPPELKIPRGQRVTSKVPGVVTMAQKVMMEEERERAIKHYRELKARKLRGDASIELERGEGGVTEGPS
ncbi:hypothetical protein F5I97DRAFT_1810454 [Phlebopus sp. FC_14]|nr:hypothetical protein F5I97DRAFT_1810454 [Phlebopus sp. FC_14]